MSKNIPLSVSIARVETTTGKKLALSSGSIRKVVSSEESDRWFNEAMAKLKPREGKNGQE